MICSLIEIVASYIELFVLFRCYSMLLKPRYSMVKSNLIIQLEVLIYVILLTVANYLKTDPYFTLVLFLVLYSVSALVVFRSKFISISKPSLLPITIIYFYCIYSFDIISASVISLLSSERTLSTLMMGLSWERLQHIAIMKFFNIIIYLGVQNYRKLDMRIKPAYITYTSLACSAVFVTSLFSVKVMLPSENIENKLTMLMSGMLYIAILLSMLYLSYKSTLLSTECENTTIIKIKLEMLEENYGALKQSRSESNKLLHEIDNKLLVILGLAKSGDSAKIVRFVEDILRLSASGQMQICTGSEVIDLVLQSKMLKAKETNIPLQFELMNMRDVQVEVVDICSILSNLLDNAIDACAKLKCDYKPYVMLIIKQQKDFLSIKVSNTALEKPFSDDKKFRTTKNVKEAHGFGLQVVKECVAKYNGHMDFDYNNCVFSVSIILCLDQ